jgi:ERF superfamily protein
MTLAEKLHAIQSLARRVAKRGKSVERAGREYDYLMIEDAVHLAKQQMRKHKLILTPSLAKKADGSFMYARPDERVIDLVFEWTLEDIESKEERRYNIPGSGWDLYDKASAKSMTNSRKYTIVMIFNLEVGNDIEDAPSPSDKQKEIAKQRIEESTGRRYESLEHAEAAMMDRKDEEAAAKKSMFIAWPEAHNGHRFLLMGRKNAPVALHKEIETCEGKWSDRESGWFIASQHAEHIRETVKKFNIPLVENEKRV